MPDACRKEVGTRMSEPLPTEELFTGALLSGRCGDIVLTVTRGRRLIRIRDHNDSVLLYPSEARALREWLDKVLP